MKETLRNGLELTFDEATGHLLGIHDPKLDMDLLKFSDASAEFSLNQRPLWGTPKKMEIHAGEHRTQLDCDYDQPSYKAGRRYTLRRNIVPNAAGNHPGRSNSIHIRYALRREPWGDWESPLSQLWGAPLEAPVYVETLTALGSKTDFFGPKTQMRQLAIGGSGPREHVSLEDGPVAEVVPYLQTGFRNTFPGQSTIPGALYYHPEDERWVWIMVRRPQVGGQIEYRPDGQAYRFSYFKQMKLHDDILCPDIGIYWGRGLDEADKVLAEQFDLYREPPAWWYNTTWFWLHPMWQPDANFDDMAKGVEILMDECGVTGFGLGIHDIPRGGHDIEDRSYRVDPGMGGDDKLKRCCDLINSKGGHSYVWYTRAGMHPFGDCRSDWAVRGEDGRRIMLEGLRIDMLNSMHPAYEQYILDGIEYYVKDIGVTGIFWDSAYQPMPPDFGDRDFLECPGEAMVCAPRFYEKAHRFGSRLSDDFFMFSEGITTESMCNVFAVDNASHGPNSGHRLMHKLAHLGPRRLVWRSAWSHDVAGAMPFVSPVCDIHLPCKPETYQKIAADPMNQWLCKTVKERGCRQAVGVADGISVLDEYVIAADKCSGEILIPEAVARGTKLTHEITGTEIEGKNAENGITFDLPESGGWKIS